MNTIKNLQLRTKFQSYPDDILEKMLRIRELIFETAGELAGADRPDEELQDVLEETLKWGEPAWRMQGGSTVRADWKPGQPDQYVLCFHCGTRLVDTFRELYGDRLQFDGNRAIVLGRQDEIPIALLKRCIAMALRYHRIKHLPLLGA